MHVCCLTVDAKNIYYSRACGRKTRYQICIKSINPNLDSLLLWLYFIMGPLCFWAPYFRLHSKLLFLVLICSYCLKNKTLERITLSTPITGHVKRWVIGLWGICSSFKFCNPKFIKIYIYILYYIVLMKYIYIYIMYCIGIRFLAQFCMWLTASHFIEIGIGSYQKKKKERNRHWHYVKIVAHWDSCIDSHSECRFENNCHLIKHWRKYRIMRKWC